MSPSQGYGNPRDAQRYSSYEGQMAPSPYSEPVQSGFSSARSAPSRRGMVLGKKGTKLNRMAAALAKEDNITLRRGPGATKTGASAPVTQAAKPIRAGDVEVVIGETLKVACARDGSCESFEVKGSLLLTAHSAAGQTAQLKLRRGENKGFKVQPNPKINRKGLQEGIITPMNPSRPFPLGKGVPVLRWRMESKNPDDGLMPLSINCWPENQGKTTNVNIEFILERDSMTLHNVAVEIPLGSTEVPVINECNGTTELRKDGVLVWHMDVVDKGNKSGALEFDIAQPDENVFFPLQVSFQSSDTFIEMDVEAAASGDSVIQTSIAKNVTVSSYEIGAGDDGF